LFLGVEAEDRITAEDFSSVPLVRRLAVAVDRGDRAAIAAAVTAGADVNAFGNSGFRLLDWAMVRNKPVSFETLLDQGADVMADYRDPRGVPDISYNCSILQRVLEADGPEFIQAVLRNGMQPNHVPFPEDGRSLLFFGLKSSDTRVLAALLDAGASVNQRDRWGNVPLSDAGTGRNFKAAWFLLQRGADPVAKDNWGNDFVKGLKEYGSRGVRPEQREYFEKVVDELVQRGLLTRQDIIEADKPKTPNAGVTVIEHDADSEAGRAISELDRREREANGRE
jgi:ankyrin repeat protein